MALQTQPFVVPIRGLDTQVDPKNAPPGTLDIAENVFLKRTAQSGFELRKRLGTTSVTKNILTGGTVSNGRKLAPYDSERLLIADTQVYSWIPTLAKWQARGPSSSCATSVEIVDADAQGAYVCDAAAGGGYLCVVTATGNTAQAHVTVIEIATGERVLNNENLGFGGNPSALRLIALASTFVVFCWDAVNGGNINARTIAYATPSTISGNTVVAADLNVANPRFDATKNGANDSCMLAYNKTVAGLKVLIVNANLTTGATANDADIPDAVIGWMNWDGSDGNVYAAYVGAAAGTKIVTVSTAAVIGAKIVVDAAIVAAKQITGYRFAGVNNVFAEIASGTTYNTLIRRWNTGAGTLAIWQRSCGLGSRVFKVGSNYYITAAYESPLQSSFFILDATSTSTPPPVIAKALYGRGGGLCKRQCVLGGAAAQSSTVAAIPVLAMSYVTAGTGALNASALLRLDTSGSGLSAAKRVGENLHLPGGIVRSYDSAQSVEAGFHLFPEQPTLAAIAGGFTGTFKAVVVYQWLDARGQKHVSAPSTPGSITLAAQGCTVTGANLRVGDRPIFPGGTGNILADVYRTTNGGSTYYKDTTASIQIAPTADTFTFNFNFSDAAIVSNEQLYTTGGVLPHIPLPPARLLETWRGRLFLAGTDRSSELWVSNEFQTGEAVSVSDALVIVVETETGAITALAEMDDRLIIFKRNAIYVLAGQGPARNGDGQFDQPARISTSIGAIGPEGITKTSDGLIFKSTRGRYLLPIGGGQPIRLSKLEGFDSYTDQGGCTIDDLEQTRIVTSNGTTLVCHTGLKDEQGLGSWTVFTGQAAVDCMIWNGKWSYLASDGTVREEVAAQFQDDGVSYTAKWRSAWVNLAGIFGRARVRALRLLFEVAAGGFTASITSEIKSSGVVTTETTTKALTTQLDPLATHPAQQRCEQIRVTVQETSAVEGMYASAFGFELGIKQGAGREPSGQFSS
jgi:hypothetical protein